MAYDQMHYDQMVQTAYRGVMRDALRRASKQGLPGDHHFYIAFRTDHPGVDISDTLRNRYPNEMTIVLQHQYWGLEVYEDYFEVGLSFNKVPERLSIPYLAVSQFVDPSVKFGLEFEVDTPSPSASLEPVPLRPAPQDRTLSPTDTPPGETPGAAVVSLDAFRKK